MTAQSHEATITIETADRKSDRVAAMTPIERAAWGLVFALDVTACDARNDAPWKALRDVHRDGINQAHAALGDALRDTFGSLTDDEWDELLGITE